MRIRYPCYNLKFSEGTVGISLLSQAIHLYQEPTTRESAVFELFRVKTYKCSCDHFSQLFISWEHAYFTTWSSQQQGKQVQICDWLFYKNPSCRRFNKLVDRFAWRKYVKNTSNCPYCYFLKLNLPFIRLSYALLCFKFLRNNTLAVTNKGEIIIF